MAVDYLIVGMTFTFAMAVLFFFLAFEEQSLRAIIYHMFSMIAFFFLATLFPMAYTATTTYVLPLSYFFYSFGLFNFLFMMMGSIQVFNLWRRKRQGIDEDS